MDFLRGLCASVVKVSDLGVIYLRNVDNQVIEFATVARLAPS
jgi:hypothetical protein